MEGSKRIYGPGEIRHPRRRKVESSAAAQLPSIGRRSLDALRKVDFNAPKPKVEGEEKDVEDKQE